MIIASAKKYRMLFTTILERHGARREQYISETLFFLMILTIPLAIQEFINLGFYVIAVIFCGSALFSHAATGAILGKKIASMKVESAVINLGFLVSLVLILV